MIGVEVLAPVGARPMAWPPRPPRPGAPGPGSVGLAGLGWIAARRALLRRAPGQPAAGARRDLAVAVALAAAWFSVWGVYAAYSWTARPGAATLQVVAIFRSAAPAPTADRPGRRGGRGCHRKAGPQPPAPSPLENDVRAPPTQEAHLDDDATTEAAVDGR
jgi:hypothetical protein